MSSSWELDSSSDASEESLQDAQLSDEELARHSPGSRQRSDPNPERVDPKQAETPSFASTPANPARLTRNERESGLRSYAEATNATLEYDDDGELQLFYPRRQSDSLHDKPSPALWRHRTTFERDISASFNQGRSSDLSIHLYNTFKLRQRAKSQTLDENGFVETKEPPRAWAAWPLTPESVPRVHQQMVWEDGDWRIGPYVKRERRPGDELRDLLIARATKTGKERFWARESEGSSSGGKGDEGFRPVVSVDDGAVEKLLRPSMQHVLGKCDSLLIALHHARSSYIAPKKADRKKTLRKSNSSRTAVSAKPDDLGTLNNDSDEDSNGSSNYEGEVSESKISGRQRTQKDKAEDAAVKVRTRFLRQKANSAGLRDWTDIFAVASMTGVGSAVISRLAYRSNGLFDADKEFRETYGGLTNIKETVFLPYDGSSKKIGKLS